MRKSNWIISPNRDGHSKTCLSCHHPAWIFRCKLLVSERVTIIVLQKIRPAILWGVMEFMALVEPLAWPFVSDACGYLMVVVSQLPYYTSENEGMSPEKGPLPTKTNKACLPTIGFSGASC